MAWCRSQAKRRPPELLDQIKHRIGPGEAAVVVSAEEMAAYMESLGTQKPEEPAS